MNDGRPGRSSYSCRIVFHRHRTVFLNDETASSRPHLLPSSRPMTFIRTLRYDVPMRVNPRHAGCCPTQIERQLGVAIEPVVGFLDIIAFLPMKIAGCAAYQTGQLYIDGAPSSGGRTGCQARR